MIQKIRTPPAFLSFLARGSMSAGLAVALALPAAAMERGPVRGDPKAAHSDLPDARDSSNPVGFRTGQSTHEQPIAWTDSPSPRRAPTGDGWRASLGRKVSQLFARRSERAAATGGASTAETSATRTFGALSIAAMGTAAYAGDVGGTPKFTLPADGRVTVQALDGRFITVSRDPTGNLAIAEGTNEPRSEPGTRAFPAVLITSGGNIRPTH